jgi:hypothetical protein
LGLAFHAGTRYGAATIAWNFGLVVVGNGMMRGGTTRGPGLAFAAFCSGSSMSKSRSVDLTTQTSSAFAVDATTLSESVAAAAVINAYRPAIAA